MKVAKPVEPVKPVEITTSIQIIKDEPGAKNPEVAKAPEPAKPARSPRLPRRSPPSKSAPRCRSHADREGAEAAAGFGVHQPQGSQALRPPSAWSRLFDTPVTIKNADKPLGTHVYTAMDLKDDGASMRWTVVSIPSAYPRDAAKNDKNDKNDKSDKKARRTTRR